MNSVHMSAPVPELRIVDLQRVLAHEEHDDQRSAPLEKRLLKAETLVNPPIVTALENDDFVILDGANRSYAFARLGFPHILVQIVSYNSGYVLLDTWSHIVSGWEAGQFLSAMRTLSGIDVVEGIGQDQPLTQMILRNGDVYSIYAEAETLEERNRHLREVVALYQQNARLFRSAIKEPHQIWPLYPDADVLMVFPKYQPEDILQAAKQRAFLPPGISRHIIHGRAVRVNYPMEALRDDQASLAEKNEALQHWMRHKLAARQVRYYAEATYQFDE